MPGMVLEVFEEGVRAQRLGVSIRLVPQRRHPQG
jgi:hypothetical protein